MGTYCLLAAVKNGTIVLGSGKSPVCLSIGIGNDDGIVSGIEGSQRSAVIWCRYKCVEAAGITRTRHWYKINPIITVAPLVSIWRGAATY
ncbi:hypothetical protein FQZ97_972480 [compost metagenome]